MMRHYQSTLVVLFTAAKTRARFDYVHICFVTIDLTGHVSCRAPCVPKLGKSVLRTCRILLIDLKALG